MARRTIVFAVLIVALLAAVVASLALGAVKVPFAEVVDVIFGGGDGGTDQQIVETLRLPRTVEALVVGAALGIAGAILQDALGGVLEQVGRPDAEARIAKSLAEYDYLSLRRLERSRILVRMGPALGLMGTLIPLSPALAGLADGDVATLTENLRIAFGVTVVGLLVGAIAFAISLIRDRLYAQDYSDVEYVAAILTNDNGNHLPVGTHSHWAVAP